MLWTTGDLVAAFVVASAGGFAAGIVFAVRALEAHYG